MGIRRIVEVLDHAPSDLTSSERMALVVIAENINDDDPGRRTWPSFSLTVLIRRTGLALEALKKALQRLARRGLEVRVPIGVDKHGRPLYAVPGKQVRFRLPALGSEGGNTVRPSPEGGNDVLSGGNPVPAEGGTGSRQGGTDSHPSPPPLDSSSLSPAPPASQPPPSREREDPFLENLAANHKATVEQVRRVFAAAERDGVRNTVAWASSDTGRLDLKRRLDELRARDAAAQESAAQHALQQQAAQAAAQRRDACPWCDSAGLIHGTFRDCDHTTQPPPDLTLIDGRAPATTGATQPPLVASVAAAPDTSVVRTADDDPLLLSMAARTVVDQLRSQKGWPRRPVRSVL